LAVLALPDRVEREFDARQEGAVLIEGAKAAALVCAGYIHHHRQESVQRVAMKISIVSPCFNEAAFVGRAIESVAEQDHADKEHLIIDGGSTDGSADLISSAADRYPHVTAVLEPDGGEADAINKGFRSSSGDILAWLNTGDYYSDSGVLSAVADFFSRNADVDIAWGRGLSVGSDGKKITEPWVQPPETDFSVALQQSIGLLQPSVFFRRSIFEAVGGLSEEHPLQLDYEYWIRIAGAGFRFGFIDRILSHATVHGDARSTASCVEHLNECLRLMVEKFEYVPIQWIRRFGECFLTHQDHQVAAGMRLDKEQTADYAVIERALLDALNGNERTRSVLRTHAGVEPYAETWREMEALDLDRPRPRRVVITSFDSGYFRQGLNLIAALHRTSLSSFDKILVYPLGLSEFERARLSSLEKVTVRDYPKETERFFEEYLHPKTRAYKACAIRSTEPDVVDGDLVLWVDAGIAPVQDFEQIFDAVAEEEFFITNHDDKPSWPFYNVNFAHPASHAPLALSNADLLGQHLCSALIGYKRGGKYQHIIDEAYRLSQIRDCMIWPKVLSTAAKHKPVLTVGEQALRDKLAQGDISPDSVSYEELLRLFDYYGHRTQTVYSVLAHRANAPVSSARIYRRANEESSAAAAVNWSESALKTDSASSRLADADEVDPAVVAYHHRGTYSNLDGLRHKRAGDALFVVGDGPSFRGASFDDLKGRAWLGMDAAYRYWTEAGCYPTYYACFDTTVLESHRTAVLGMVEGRASLGISKVFLSRSILKYHPVLAENPAVYFLEDLQAEHPSWFPHGLVGTASCSVLVGWFLGYRDIHLINIDSNYSAPNGRRGMDLREWAQVRVITEGFPMRITNLDSGSGVRSFPFEDYGAVAERIGSREALPERIADRAVQEDRERRYWRRRFLLEHETTPDARRASIEELLAEEEAMREVLETRMGGLVAEQRATRKALEGEGREGVRR
jgi:GT2 family glycosyltransferase